MDDTESLARIAEEAQIVLSGRGTGPVYLDGEDVSEAIRSPEVSNASSVMSTVPRVRRAMVRQQRKLGHSTDCVMEGRDIGTVVFPDADLKVFIVASIDERARRRLQDHEKRDEAFSLEDVIEEIRERDRRDSTRLDSPLVKAEDAVELDTTNLTVDEQVDAVIELACARGALRNPAGDEARGGTEHAEESE
jgi:cytidylate kinase